MPDCATVTTTHSYTQSKPMSFTTPRLGQQSSCVNSISLLIIKTNRSKQDCNFTNDCKRACIIHKHTTAQRISTHQHAYQHSYIHNAHPGQDIQRQQEHRKEWQIDTHCTITYVCRYTQAHAQKIKGRNKIHKNPEVTKATMFLP